MRCTAVLLFLACGQYASAGYNVVQSAYSNSTIRVKSWSADDKSLCDGGSRHHTGWVDVVNKHTFFWFHEARAGIENAPLLLWVQGGPGGSALAGMFLEHGPCLMDTNDSTAFNPHAWTEAFNVVYVDQPVGVGLSYVDGNDEAFYPNRTEESTLHLLSFLNLFYEAFPKLQLQDLHISGESYAGRFIPLFGAEILKFNEWVPDDGHRIPLRSLMIGNGWTSPKDVLPAWYDVACYDYRGYPPHLDESVCEYLLPLVDKCRTALKTCAATRDTDMCVSTNSICKDQFADVVENNTTRSAFDRRLRNCNDGETCFGKMPPLINYLNSPKVHKSLELQTQTGGLKSSWSLLDVPTANRYMAAGDYHFPSVLELENILNYRPSSTERPVDVLYYVGVADIVCSPLGVQQTLEGLQWPGSVEFHAVPWADLPYKTAANGPGGRVKSAKSLTLMELEEAGHLVPLDQPVMALQMVKDWLRYLETGVPLTRSESSSHSSEAAASRSKFVVQEL
ncbi:hypothetical protein PFICI_11826 [Pestalotiopsis fici W106-1]|uniref:Carboxypeptidase n=1 Tax=Pestalotiopsis fici (strain W106-1 / CGMCC3.15140) TaxID=1229662 RepID=W3WRH1_PESFW|nr:uncharacterized protein PFICI_11826 [Pestalotiopsis fici W106-1]ETS76439.1 hypothetical protein PFICI_11826 [Pestalotiopsis fici W106-1]